MGVKSDKTFEEIVERLVALSAPQQPRAGAGAQPQPTSLNVVEHLPPALRRPAALDEDAQG